MTEIQQKQEELDVKQDIADKDREQRDKDSKRKLAGSIVGGILGAGSNIASGFLKRGKNDKAWYNKNKGLVESVANVSFEAPLGSTYVGGHRVGGVCIFDFLPVLPHTEGTEVGTAANNRVDPTLSLSFQALYAKERAKNSGARNYEPKDLNKYVLAITSYYNTIAEAKKIYDLVQTFNSNNTFFGNRLLKAYNIDSSLIGDLPRLKALIEYHAQASDVYTLPDEMSVISRQVWLTNAVFADHDMSKTQVYMFRPVGYYVIRSATSTALDFKVYPWVKGSGAVTYDRIAAVLDSQLTKLLSDPYASIISGDIRKAFSTSNFYKVSSDIKFVPMTPKYSEEVLSQIENATIVGLPGNVLSNGQFDVTQANDTDTLYQDLPSIVLANPSNTDNMSVRRLESFEAYINMYKDNVEPDDVMVATRLQCKIDLEVATDNTVRKVVKSCGTEIILDATILYVEKNIDSGLVNSSSIKFCSYMSAFDAASEQFYPHNYSLVGNLDIFAQFDWLPGYYYTVMYPGENLIQVSRFVNEFKNVASVAWTKQEAMHKVAGLSEYGLTSFATE